MPDFDAEQAEMEITDFVNKVQKKWRISSKTMSFIIGELAEDYQAKGIAEEFLHADGNTIPEYY